MTTTPFSLLLQLSLMSQAEAAEYLKVRPDTVQKWVSGRDPCPPGVIEDIQELIDVQQIMADKTDPANPLIELQPNGLKLWGTLGAWRGYAARVIADAPHGAEIVIKPAPPET